MAFQFTIATGTGTPIYKQLVDQLKAAVASEEIAQGYQLPSIRALAERIVVNPNTVARSYGEMVRDGLIETQPGRGYFVAQRRQRLSDAEQERRLSAAVDVFVHDVLLLGFPQDVILDRVRAALQNLEPVNRNDSEATGGDASG
jgi:GntR family transcriptional regulator